MTPEELRQIRDLYEKALRLDGSALDQFLEAECQGQMSGQASVREEVERLLEAQRRIPTWLNRPALGAFAAVPRMEGRQIGGYTLVREIGRGGMGCVYLAERSDGAFQKQAAIKLVLPSPHTATVIARFQHERQILASLDHPNIARLLDGGLTEEGWPYFVMEFVDGQPIDRWCDARKLNVSQRIELFRGVIAAVQYAHQHLVVHRDLKPGNIYVTNDGTVKLLDFGIAKVLSVGEPGAAAETVTLAGMMTPEYASPEQVNGTPITTLSDVYSLGVILYELLTGHRPYRLLSAAMHEVARVISDVEPARPSQVVATTESGTGRNREPVTPASVCAVREGDLSRLRKRLAGDLDSILLMSLRKEPERRYSSVEAMAGDLERHLGNRPVAARDSTPWYRLIRFCRRNVGGVAAAILVSASLLAGAGAIIWQTRHELTVARTAALDAGPVVLFIFGVAAVGLGLAIYLVRPGRRKFCGALAGGVIWTTSNMAIIALENSLGWWRSQIPGIPEPLLVFGQPIWRSPYPWMVQLVSFTAVMFFVHSVQRRHGWSWTATCLVGLGLARIVRDRFWFSTVLPVIAFSPVFGPVITEVAIDALGGLVGLLVMRLIAQQSNRSS